MEWTWGRTTRTMVLSETQPRGWPDTSSGSAEGPGVRFVPRRRLRAGHTSRAETAFRAVVRGFAIPRDRGSCLHPELWDDEPPLRLGSTQLGWIKDLSGLEETKGERGELARQRHAGEFFAHSTLEHSVIEVL